MRISQVHVDHDALLGTHRVMAKVNGFWHFGPEVPTVTKAKRHAKLLRGINRRIADDTASRDDIHLAKHLLRVSS